jgi:ribosomal protein S24E
MSHINLFEESREEPSHPRLRYWSARIRAGETAKLEVYHPPTSLGMVNTKMYVHFYKSESEAGSEEADWEQVLNEGLIALRVRALDQANEAERFSLGLRDGLRQIEKEFGNGYFNAVLLDLLQESDIHKDEVIAGVLEHTYHNSPERNRSYDRCRESIAIGIGARARELRKQLAYSPEEMRSIMTTATAKYLDGRFSVSSRRQLGLL